MKNKILVGIIIISIIIGVSTLTRGHDWGDDFAWYILQAKSILNGTTIEFMQQSEFTNTQSTTHVGPLAYPWGYPLILTPVYAIKGISPLALKLPGVLFYAGFLICLYLLISSRLTRIESLLIVSLFAFNPMLIEFENQILSDIPFLFFSTLTLLLMTQENKNSILRYVLIGAAVFLTTFMRATGILLLGCFLLIEFFRFLRNIKNREMVKQIILNSFLIVFVFALLWLINTFLFPSGGESYLSQYAGLTIETIRGFTVSYFNVFSQFFGEAAGWRYLYYILFIFFLLGAWIRRKDETIFIVFTIFWMIVHITYPYWQGPRYIFPILPIFIYFTFQGMRATINKLPENYRFISERLHYGFWAVVACIFLFTSSANAIRNLRDNRAINGPFDPYSVQVYDYIKEKTSPDSVVVFFKPRVMIMMTGHNTIMSMECDRMLSGDYLAISKKVEENQQIPPDQIDECSLPLDKVLENRRFIVYEVQK
jgi:4-amino-4-deoxy-L-arabinose transferase-like glycosyltransferase